MQVYTVTLKSLIFSTLVGFLALFFSFLFLLFFYLVAYGLPGPGIRSEMQLQSMLQLQQCWIINFLCCAS